VVPPSFRPRGPLVLSASTSAPPWRAARTMPMENRSVEADHEAARPRGGELAPGTNVSGRYEIEALLSISAFGEVYRALDLEVHTPCALRLFPPGVPDTDVALERLKRDIALVMPLDHKNVVQTYGLGEHEGRYYVVTELVEGQSLVDLLERKRQQGK